MTYPHPAVLLSGQATISVLVVDDYEDAAEMLGEYIQLACHCSVGVAQNGIEALVAVGAFQPAIIVMDVDMPFMDGIETAVLVRQRAGSKVPILIALTGGPRLADAQADGSQPFDLTVLGYAGNLDTFADMPGRDALSISAVVPEPASWALMVAGVLAATVMVRRNQRVR